jgi:bisphosphoglycerate-dependent phosphoglycerate mutase
MEFDKMKKKRSPYQRVSDENMEKIENSIGKFGESFDDVLKRLIQYWEEGHKPEK